MRYHIITCLLIALAACVVGGTEAYAQRVTNASYQTVAHIKSDGTIQDSNYRTIGHAEGIPKAWAAWYFFF